MPTTNDSPDTANAVSGPSAGPGPAPVEEPRLEAGETPQTGLSNAGKIVRYALQRAGEKKLTQVASSLTFTTVLAIVPLLAVVLSLFTAFPLFAEFRVALEHFLTSSLMPPAVSDNVMLYLNQFAAKASGLTAVGSLFLIVTSVMLIMTIDEAFNDIWQVERQRPFRQRILVYWAIISLGPILTGASLWATSILARESIGNIAELPTAVGFALSFVPLLATGLGFTALFVGVPNRRVLWKDALIGGLGTAIVLEIMRVGFAYYLTRFPSYTVIYGAFATLPIFLLWIYLSWLAILLGATVAATLPALRQRRWALQHYRGAPFVDALRVLRVLWDAQSTLPAGRSMRFLCAHLQLHQDELSSVLGALKRLGYAVNTENGDADQWVLACDQREATIGPLIDELLLDREQPGLAMEPLLLDAISVSLTQAPRRLADLFDDPGSRGGEILPESAHMVQNTPIAEHRNTQEKNHAESQ
ncbi:YihY family inner membrane protein [Pollutimonas sp. M17]|uniref:YihY family inner membrane protein n=1 Tax=Pollutimonas sp. M17 TaxID=2962065 RepID=UPI0021F4B621|nr:YihY family inner membrane protein [Pollutimonas sp. M17]UYO92283.1 YihY family inner membrane protein [Pollutimonas sp. M17]HWK70119.1 YihY family inner membrane protein [Burkholderiaceae bacterium]